MMISRLIIKYSMDAESAVLAKVESIIEFIEQLIKEYEVDENRVYLISKGDGTFSINSKGFPFQTGDLIFCFRGEEIHANKTNKCAI